MLSLGVLIAAVLFDLALQMQRDSFGILLRDVFTRYQRFAYQLPCSSPALAAVSRLAAPRLNGDARTSACLMGHFNLIGQLASGSGPTVHRSPRGGCLHERQGTSIMTGVPMQARCGLACVGGSYPPQGGLHHRSDPFTVASMRTLLSALVCPFL